MAVYDLNNQYDAQKFKDKVQELLQRGGGVELKRLLPVRRNQQNRYLYLLLGFFASEFGMSVDEVKIDFFKRKVNADIFERVKENSRGNRVKYLRSTAELDRREMTVAIERFRNWSASVAGLYLPSADEQYFLVWVQKQIEKDKEFLYETKVEEE